MASKFLSHFLFRPFGRGRKVVSEAAWFAEDSVFPIPWVCVPAEQELRGCSWTLHSAMQCVSFYSEPGTQGPLGCAGEGGRVSKAKGVTGLEWRLV